MKILFLITLLFSSLAIPQDVPVEPKETIVYEFDARCLAPLRWSTSLVAARLSGTTKIEVIERMRHDYVHGSLSGYQDETILYMLEIVHVVFESPIDNNQEILDVLQVVEGLCVTFIETRAKPADPAKQNIST